MSFSQPLSVPAPEHQCVPHPSPVGSPLFPSPLTSDDDALWDVDFWTLDNQDAAILPRHLKLKGGGRKPADADVVTRIVRDTLEVLRATRRADPHAVSVVADLVRLASALGSKRPKAATLRAVRAALELALPLSTVEPNRPTPSAHAREWGVNMTCLNDWRDRIFAATSLPAFDRQLDAHNTRRERRSPVCGLDGQLIQLPLVGTMTGAEVVILYNDRTVHLSEPASRLRIIFKGTLLDNAATLASSGWGYEDTIHIKPIVYWIRPEQLAPLVAPRHAGRPPSFFDGVRDSLVVGIDGLTLVVSLDANMTAADVVMKYNSRGPRMSDPIERLRVVFQGSQLAADDTLASLGWTYKDALHVLPRIRAGGLKPVPATPSPVAALPVPRRQSPRLQEAESARSPEGQLPRTSISNSLAQSEPAQPLASVPLSPMLEAPRHSPRIARSALAAIPSVEPIGTARSYGPPQPVSATAARSQSTASVADSLAANTSIYAICPDDPGRLRSMVSTIGKLRFVAIPKGTKAADEWGFSWVRRFCIHMGPTVRWMRPFVTDPALDPVNEAWFTCLAMLFIAQHMKPSARRRARGFDEAQPPSALLAIYGWMRVQRDCSRYVCSSSELRTVLRGLCKQYMQTWGQEAFVKQQALVFTRGMLLTIAAACKRQSVPGWLRAQHYVWSAASKYQSATGARTNELVSDFEGDDVLLRSNFTTVDDAREPVTPTPAVLLAVKNGDLIRGVSAASKCDRLNVEWSKQKQWFRYDDTDPLNFAVAWVAMELQYPCSPELRGSWPAFSPSGDASPFTTHSYTGQHRELITHALGSGAEGRTPHSHRATLASAFAVARAKGGHPEITDAVIQAQLRWKTIDSLLSYAKMHPDDYADNVALATRTDAGRALRADTPEHEPNGVISELLQAADVLDDAPSKRPPKRDAPGAACPAATRGGDGRARLSPSGKAPTGEQRGRAPPSPAIEAYVHVVDAPRPVRDLGADSWNIVGSDIKVPDLAWGCAGESTTLCTITHFIGRFRFPQGASHIAYTVTPREEPGANYALRADYVRGLLPPAIRNKLRPQKLPTAAPTQQK